MDSTVDPTSKGFLNIFGGDSAASDTNTDSPADPSTQAEPTAADADAPEQVSDQDLTAEEVVAARLAASLEADGIEIPDPDGEEEPPDSGDHPLLGATEGEPSLDEMTPEQLRALAEEAIRLRGEVSTSTQAEAARKVQMAEAAAVAQVQTAYERDMAASAQHYQTFYRNELAKVAREVTEAELPDAAAALAGRVWAAQREYETGLLDGTDDFVGYEALSKQAALSARLQSPDFRQYAAAELVKQAGLPQAAVAEVLKTADTRQFEARIAELVAIRDALQAERAKNQASRRKEANARLAESTVRTATTGRSPGGKLPDYKGIAAEGIAIIRS
jgi:hypothetical protein